MARITAVIALCLLVVAFVVFLVGFVTPLWLWSRTHTNVRLGLWQACTIDCFGLPLDYGFYKATQAMETLGLLCVFGAIPSFILYLYYSNKEEKRANRNLTWLFSFLFTLISCVFIIIGVISFGARYHEVVFSTEDSSGPYVATDFQLSWSFGLTTGAGILFLCSGILLTADRFFN